MCVATRALDSSAGRRSTNSPCCRRSHDYSSSMHSAIHITRRNSRHYQIHASSRSNYNNSSSNTNSTSQEDSILISSPWLLTMVSDLVANLPDIQAGDEEGGDGAMIVRVTRNTNRKTDATDADGAMIVRVTRNTNR